MALSSFFGIPNIPEESKKIEFWKDPERSGWLTKQGEYLKTWRRRWFVLKQGHMFWFKGEGVTQDSHPRGVINVGKCLTIKGAEDVINRAHAFELSTANDTLFFIAESDKEKEDWINSVGRAIVRHSKSVTDYEVLDYNTNTTTNTRVARPINPSTATTITTTSSNSNSNSNAASNTTASNTTASTPPTSAASSAPAATDAPSDLTDPQVDTNAQAPSSPSPPPPPATVAATADSSDPLS